jgi:hypothetical protein
MFSNANKIFTYNSQQKFKIKSYFLIKKKIKKYLIINLPQIPLSKKPLNMRMGKGKGGVKSWVVRINAGTPFITLKSTKIKRNIFILHLFNVHGHVVFPQIAVQASSDVP